MGVAGLPALQSGEPGQVRKEAATAGHCKCRGLGSPLTLYRNELSSTCAQIATEEFREPGRPGARRSRAPSRARDKAPAPRVPLYRYARRRQDEARAHPCEMPELRNRGDAEAVRQVFGVRRS